MNDRAGQAPGEIEEEGLNGRNEAKRRFVRHLRELARPLHIDVWFEYPHLVTTVDLCDDRRKYVLRTLRVDFNGARVWGGNDPTHQIASDLDTADPDWWEGGAVNTPEECAQLAAAFFARQAGRPIDREEWECGAEIKCRWTLADVGRGIVTQGGIPAAPPTRIHRVVLRNP